MANKEPSQLARFSEILARIQYNVTPGDRDRACKKFGITEVTMSRYFKGIGGNADTAANLIFFFKQCIKDREQKVIA